MTWRAISDRPYSAVKSPTTANGFREWCRSEMRTLNNSEDMTLVDFLVSLPSAGRAAAQPDGLLIVFAHCAPVRIRHHHLLLLPLECVNWCLY